MQIIYGTWLKMVANISLMKWMIHLCRELSVLNYDVIIHQQSDCRKRKLQ